MNRKTSGWINVRNSVTLKYKKLFMCVEEKKLVIYKENDVC